MSTLTATMMRKYPETITYPPPQGLWTYEDYERLPDNEFRYEIIKGFLYMANAPRPIHQLVVANLIFLIKFAIHTGNLKGQAYSAPIEVLMGEITTPVQPDVLFIRQDNLGIVGETNIDGIPDFIAEVLSSNKRRDRVTKFAAYAEAGVPEYWIIDPDKQTVEVYVLRGHAYAMIDTFGINMVVRSEVMSSLTIKVEELFR